MAPSSDERQCGRSRSFRVERSVGTHPKHYHSRWGVSSDSQSIRTGTNSEKCRRDAVCPSKSENRRFLRRRIQYLSTLHDMLFWRNTRPGVAAIRQETGPGRKFSEAHVYPPASCTCDAAVCSRDALIMPLADSPLSRATVGRFNEHRGEAFRILTRPSSKPRPITDHTPPDGQHGRQRMPKSVFRLYFPFLIVPTSLPHSQHIRCSGAEVVR
jgi:hypothetical protein